MSISGLLRQDWRQNTALSVAFTLAFWFPGVIHALYLWAYFASRDWQPICDPIFCTTPGATLDGDEELAGHIVDHEDNFQDED